MEANECFHGLLCPFDPFFFLFCECNFMLVVIFIRCYTETFFFGSQKCIEISYVLTKFCRACVVPSICLDKETTYG